MTNCKTCGAEIVWGVTINDKRVPLDPPEKRFVHIGDTLGAPLVQVQDTWLSHFATCPQADEHRKHDD